MHNGAGRTNRLRASANVRAAVFCGATLDSRSATALAHRRPAALAGRLFGSAGTALLRNAGRRSTLQCCQSTRLAAELLGVSHVTPQSSPPQRPVPVVSGDAGGAVAEGEGTGDAGAGGVGSGSAGGVGVEVTPVEDTAASSQWPRPPSPPGFPSVPQFPPCSSLWPVAAEPGGVPAGGTRGLRAVGGGGAGSVGAGARGIGTVAPTPRTVRFLTREQRLLRLKREERERSQQRVQLQPQQEMVEEEPQEQQQRQLLSQQMPEEVERQRLRLRDLHDPSPARLVLGPLRSPPIPLVHSLSSSQWTHRSPLSRAVSPEPRRSRYHTDGPFHLVLRSHVPPPPVLPQPPVSSLTVFHDPLSDYLRASHPVVSRVFSALVTHPTAPQSSVSALVTTVAGFASSHRLDYTAHLVSGPARSPSSGGAPVFSLEVLKDTQLELGFLAAAAVSGPWALYWIAVEEAEMASYRSTGTYVDAVPPPGTNVVSGMWLYKVKRPPGSPPWQLRRPVYGLRQAPHEWHDTLSTTLVALDFLSSSADPSLFVRRDSTPFFVLVYIDNLVFTTPNRHALASMMEELQRRHTCTNLGELPRPADHQGQDNSHHYADSVAYGQADPHMVSLPVLQAGGLSHVPDDLYSPFYLMYPLSVLARFFAPGRHQPSHWYAAKKVAKYVASTSGMGLVLEGKQSVTLTDFSDSSWADDAKSLRSTLGYYLSLGTGAVSWRSTQASSVSSSSREAEVYDVAMAAQELRWFNFLLTDLGERPRSPPVLFADNITAVQFCEEP
ncbi:unnamed protein product [Closterium sp. NIES-53]